MDLEAHERPDLSAATLDAWLSVSGDFDGLAPLRFFHVYRALVRAMVNGIRARQHKDIAATNGRERYLQHAERQMASPAPRLVVIAGTTGSGKSWLAERLLTPLTAIRIRSDVERKRIAGLCPLATSGGTIYTPDLTTRTYDRLNDAARQIISAGFTAVIDAACLLETERAQLRATAAQMGVPFSLLWVHAPRDLLLRRIAARQAAANDPSEATATVLESQLRFAEKPDATELSHGLCIDSSAEIDVAHLARWIKQAALKNAPG